ncbi:MAG: hypothetical protein IKF59_12795 [Lachnospiraceae bacterium]|nr:hypothetical protein [Lachnospiraceae bacterium]
MALLDGFKLIELKEKIEESTLTISAKALRFNRGTARDLGRPGKVRFLVNEKLLQLAVIPAQDDDEDGVDFSYDENSREVPISVKEPAVLNTVKKLAVLEKDGQAVRLVLKGNVYLEERAVIYDLTEAETVAVKPRGRRKAGKAET